MDAHRWLQGNRARFRGHVYGPIAVEVRMFGCGMCVCFCPANGSIALMVPCAVLTVHLA